MRLVDKIYDTILDVNYEVYAVSLKDLRTEVLSWYEGLDLTSFDERKPNKNNDYEDFGRIIKESGITCNYFFAMKDGEEFYLLDGFNRLLTSYGVVDSDQIIYLKVITDELSDGKLMSVMFNLNLWKLYSASSSRGSEFNTHNFFDRGFRLLLHKKFGLNIHSHDGDIGSWTKRTQEDSDFTTFDFYFRKERDFADYFKMGYVNVKKLFSHENVINDLKEFAEINKYLAKDKFNHYEEFMRGFVMFVSRRRLAGDNGSYKFQTYLDLLFADKFFKKLKGMSWTDSTRKNVFYFFNKIEGDMK